MQVKTLAMAAMTAMTAMTTMTACEPEGTCVADVDCAFGQVCGVEGVCVYVARDADEAVDPMLGTPWGGDVVSTFSTPGTFDGSIGGAPVTTADVVGEVSDGGVGTRLTAVGQPSTFLLVQLPWSVLRSPGTTVQTSDWLGLWAQACNYDSAAYDESFVEVVVDVSPPREAEPGDQIIAEDTPDEVIDVIVSVDGEGSTVTGAFTMPAP